MSSTVVAVILNILVMVLPRIGVTLGTDQLTSAIQVVVAIIGGAWIWFTHVQSGNLTFFGGVKK